MENLREQGKLGPDVLWLADIQQDKHENDYVDQWHYTRHSPKKSPADMQLPAPASGGGGIIAELSGESLVEALLVRIVY
jgi:hypothetical protein